MLQAKASILSNAQAAPAGPKVPLAGLIRVVCVCVCVCVCQVCVCVSARVCACVFLARAVKVVWCV